MTIMATHPIVPWKKLAVGCIWLIAGALAFVISVAVSALLLLQFVH
jgi:hypothetical protein